MSDIEVKGLDLSSPETVKKGLHDIVERQKTLAARGDSMTEQISKKSEELKTLSARLTELETRGGSRPDMEGEAHLDRFVRRDGSLRMKGETTSETGYEAGLLDADPVCDWQQDLQKAVQDYTIVKAISGKAPKSLAKCRDLMSRAPKNVKRIWTDVASSGAEWIPDVMLATFERELELERNVASLFQTVQMNNKTEILPFLSSGLVPYKKGAPSSDDPARYRSSSLGTESRTITAVGQAVRAQVDEDSAEDAIVNAIPLITAELSKAIIDGEEDCLLNGNTDTSSTGNVDDLANWNIRSRWTSTTGGSDDHRRRYIGLRHRAFDVSNTTDQGSAQTVAGFMAARAKLASPHGLGNSLVSIVSPEYYLTKMLLFGDGSAGSAGVVDVSRYGPAATILTGELGQLMGVPIVISELMGADLAATGLFTGSGTKTGMLMFNRDRFRIGRLRNSIAVASDITRGTRELVATERSIFFTIDSASKKNVHFSFNLNSTP